MLGSKALRRILWVEERGSDREIWVVVVLFEGPRNLHWLPGFVTVIEEV